MLILMEATGQVCVDCERPFDDGEMARMCRFTGGLACDDREACERRQEQVPRQGEWVEIVEVRHG